MNYLKITLIYCLFICSCNNTVDDVNNPQNFANAGEDQITYVGSYVVLDPTKGKITNETINTVEWIQDTGNPAEIWALAPSLNETSLAGFVKEGVYKLTLKITCKSGNIFTDDLSITVKPRQLSVIEDVNLEIRIRQRLNLKVGELQSDKLFLLDTLSNTNFALKNKITTLNGLEYCSNLKFLLLGLENITDLKPIAKLTKLEVLDFNQNRVIEDITPLNALINLKKLVLYSNPIKDIYALKNLTNLIELWLLDTPINDITALSGLVNLQVLYMDGVGTGSNFISIEPLRNLVKLTYLDIAGRGITDINPLERLTNLVLLNVSFNSITEISAVSNMKKLVRLYLRQNIIDNLSGIKNLEALDYLDAKDNQIIDISELQYLPQIHLIGLSDNKIKDILPLINNVNIGKSVFIYLGNNPLNDKSINEYIPILTSRGVTVYMM
jgi:Leucine-rich repeat (LRR) protein